jgi:hypothetical protein
MGWRGQGTFGRLVFLGRCGRGGRRGGGSRGGGGGTAQHVSAAVEQAVALTHCTVHRREACQFSSFDE